MTDFVNPNLDVAGYTNTRHSHVCDGHLVFVPGSLFGQAVLTLDGPTVIDQEYRVAATISELGGTVGTPRVYFTTPGGNSPYFEADGLAEFVFTATSEMDTILVRTTTGTAAKLAGFEFGETA